MRIIQKLLTLTAIAYLILCAGLYVFQRDMMYKPKAEYDTPSSIGLPEFEEITLNTSDGIALTSWYKPAELGQRTILYFHGNAGGLSKRKGFYRKMIDAGYGVLALEYRGYSLNAGLPSEEGLYLDARSAIAWLHKKGVSESQVILMGRSLGSGVAVHMATEMDAFAVLLISPYSSVAHVAKERYPYVPVNVLLKDVFDSLGKVHAVDEPILIFHGTQDRVIPVHHAHALYQAIGDDIIKELYIYDGLNHSNIDFSNVLKALARLERRNS